MPAGASAGAEWVPVALGGHAWVKQVCSLLQFSVTASSVLSLGDFGRSAAGSDPTLSRAFLIASWGRSPQWLRNHSPKKTHPRFFPRQKLICCNYQSASPWLLSLQNPAPVQQPCWNREAVGAVEVKSSLVLLSGEVCSSSVLFPCS